MGSSLKAVKTCVLRNPAARCRCRSAGIFSFLTDILDVILDDEKEEKDAEDKLLVELLFTTLAAVCLGDDLNALQASTQFKPYMDRTKTIHGEDSDDCDSSLDQKIQYLEKLFAAINEEQSELLTFLQKNNDEDKNENGKTSYQTFIQNVNDAEINIRNGYINLQSKNYKQSKNHYNLSLTLIEPYVDHTKLLQPLLVEVRAKRGQCSYEMNDAEECLVDTTYLLEQERLGESAPMITINVLKLHSKALTMLGRNDEAKESLGKLSILSPDDEEVLKMMQGLEL